MPCCACTTGSPTRSSDRSRTIISTLLARSCCRLPPRRRTRAASSVQLRLGQHARSAGSVVTKPSCSGADAQRERRARLDEVGVRCRTRRASGRTRRTSAASSRVGPAESAATSVAPDARSRWRFSASSGSVARRSTATSGAGPIATRRRRGRVDRRRRRVVSALLDVGFAVGSVSGHAGRCVDRRCARTCLARAKKSSIVRNRSIRRQRRPLRVGRRRIDSAGPRRVESVAARRSPGRRRRSRRRRAT